MLSDSQIASIIEESWDKEAAWIEVHVDMKAVRKLQVRLPICATRSGLKLARNHPRQHQAWPLGGQVEDFGGRESTVEEDPEFLLMSRKLRSIQKPLGSGSISTPRAA